jgi:TRAP-type C4-dicarboxylate transport system substrate-binding protein
MLRKAMMAVATACVLLGAASEAKAQGKCSVDPAKTKFLKIGTVAPKNSAWGEVFTVWSEAFTQRTNCAFTLQFMWNGSKGDEVAMVKAIRSGELDGAAVTANGLGQIDKDYLIYQLPGLFSSWEALDRARDNLRDKFAARFQERGFKVLGTGDIGKARTMTAGFDVAKPDDLKGKGAYYFEGDPIAPALYQVIGGITPKQTTVTQILPSLQSKAINVVNSPALAAEQLQWAAYLDHVGTVVNGYAIGALVMSTTYKDAKGNVHEGSFDKLPEEARKVLLETGEKSGKALSARVRNMDDQAFQRLSGKMKNFAPDDNAKLEWAKIFYQTRQKLRGTEFSAAMFDEVMKHADLAAQDQTKLKAAGKI